MNQQNPAAPNVPGEHTSDTPNPGPAPARQSKADKPTEAKRFAAYDTALLRFVGGVHDSKADAKKAAKDKGVADGDIDVREV